MFLTVDKVKKCLWQSVLFVPLLIFSNAPGSSMEPVVHIRFYNSWVFKINVKTYAVTSGNTSKFTIGCDVENIPEGTVGYISLSNGGTFLEGLSLTDSVSLVWTGGLLLNEESYSLRCEVNVSQSGLRADVSLSDVKVFPGITTDRPMCLPENANYGSFLQGEIVTILCFASGNAEWYSSADEVLLANSEIGGRLFHENDTRVSGNYVQLNNQRDANLICMSRRTSNENYCHIETQNLPNEPNLTLTINPSSFDIEQVNKGLTFTCHSNLPTEHIQWRAMTSKCGNLLDFFNSGNATELYFSIKHSLNESQLIFSERVSDLVSVSCSTQRAGFVATAIAQTTAQKSNSGLLTTMDFIAITTSLLFVISSSALAFVILKQRNAHNKFCANATEREASEPEHRNASERVADAGTYESNMHYVARDHPMHNESSNGAHNLSAAMLEEGAVITTNDIYQSSELQN